VADEASVASQDFWLFLGAVWLFFAGRAVVYGTEVYPMIQSSKATVPGVGTCAQQ